METKEHFGIFRGRHPLAIAIFAIGVAAAGASDGTVDCDGYPVPTGEEIGRELQQRLDTVSNSALLDIGFDFWEIPSSWTPDSCRVNPCPESWDTLPRHYYRAWSERLFKDHELFQISPLDTIHPIVPGQLEIMPGYNQLLARKATILAIAQECFIKNIGNALYFASVRKPGPVSPTGKAKGRQVDAMGRSLESGARPLKPGFVPPTFLIR